jgi:hypothetical protein
MNSNLREHSYGDLREVVIEIMLDDSESGTNNLERVLEKTALELCRRDGLATGQHFSRGPASQLHPSDSELVLEIVWDLARQGILTLGVNASNPSSPCLRRSRFSEYALRRGAHPFHNNTGFMKALRWEAADISPDAVVYLREAVSAFYMDCLLSTCVMLSVGGGRRIPEAAQRREEQQAVWPILLSYRRWAERGGKDLAIQGSDKTDTVSLSQIGDR